MVRRLVRALAVLGALAVLAVLDHMALTNTASRESRLGARAQARCANCHR